MCGLAGIYETRGGRADLALAERMAAALAHRGPDGAGRHASGPIALAFRRLAIVDRAGGDQPLQNEDGSLWLVCNGEIYRHEALRRDLEARGHRPRTASDAEVLLHLYEDHGEQLFNYIDGQYAFALYDQRRDVLLLGRDRMGICPLYWTQVGEALIFGSEMKALLQHPGVDRRVDLGGLDSVLCFPGTVAPRTLVRGLHSLPAGHALRAEGDQLRTWAYWDLDYPLEGEAQEQASEAVHIDRLEALLDQAVERRLQGERPVGVYLSGGLDSSLVAALAARRAPGLASFSVTFDDPGLDESRWQRAVAHQAGLRHHELRFRSEEIGDRLAEMVRHAECPVKETYNVCAMALAEAAREAGVRVVLGGEGADELFAGYAGYKVEQHGRGAAPALDRALEEGLNRRLWGAPLRYERDLQAHRALRAELYSEDLQAELRRFDCTRGPLLDAAMLRGRHPLHQRSYLDVKLRLGEHLLGDHGDRMAMSRGVEARFPFLDGEVVDFARRLPPDLKLKGYREKHIVREVAARHLPPSVLAREKFGFHAPGSPALLQAGLPWVAELLAPARIARDGVWSPAAVSWLVQRNTQPGFRLDLPFEEDLLLVVLTFNLLLDELQLSGLS